MESPQWRTLKRSHLVTHKQWLKALYSNHKSKHNVASMIESATTHQLRCLLRLADAVLTREVLLLRESDAKALFKHANTLRGIHQRLPQLLSSKRADAIGVLKPLSASMRPLLSPLFEAPSYLRNNPKAEQDLAEEVEEQTENGVDKSHSSGASEYLGFEGEESVECSMSGVNVTNNNVSRLPRRSEGEEDDHNQLNELLPTRDPSTDL